MAKLHFHGQDDFSSPTAAVAGLVATISVGREEGRFFPDLPEGVSACPLRRGIVGLVSQPIAAPCDGDHFGVVQEPVEDRRGAGDVAHQLAPVLQRPVRGHNGRTRLVSATVSRVWCHRPYWPRGSPCAKPNALVAGQPGDKFTLDVSFLDGRRHLPIVKLRRAA